jgi:hypothetical protein
MIFTFSGALSAAPVEIRVIDRGAPGNAQVLAPGTASFTPAKHGRSFSFMWESTSPRRDDDCGSAIRMEWRSPTGREVKLHRSHVVIHYQAREGTRGKCLE